MVRSTSNRARPTMAHHGRREQERRHEGRTAHRRRRRAGRRAGARRDADRADARRPGADRDRAGGHRRRDQADGQRAPCQAAGRRPRRGREPGPASLLPPRRPRRGAAARKPDGRGLPHRRRAPALEPARAGAAQGARLLRPPRRRPRRAAARQPFRAAPAAPARRGARADVGVDVESLARQRRPLCRACLDWSVRRHHLAGSLGAALLARCLELGWLRRVRDSRVLDFSAAGERAFRERFGLAAM